MLTDAQKNDIEILSALDYLPVDIAVLIKVDVSEFLSELEDESSEIYKHYRIGELQVRANANIELMKLAEGGNITAIQTLLKNQKDMRRRKLLRTIEN